MHLYIFRHSIAEPHGRSVTDEQRALTPQGRARFESRVAQLTDKGVAFDHILASPFRRTQETAHILASCLKSGKPQVCEQLLRSPGSELLERLRHKSNVHVALVGHFPHVGELAALLAFGAEELGGRFFFNPGTMAHLEGNPRPLGMALMAFSPM